MTNAERQARYKARLAAAGLVQLNIWVPPAAVDSFQRAGELTRADPRLAVARLVNRETGKLCGLRGPRQIEKGD